MPLAAQPATPVRADSLGLLSRTSGLALRAFRPEHVERQVAATLQSESLSGPGELAELMTRSVDARLRFRSSIAISVSGPLRDAHQFELLRDEVFPAILKREGIVRAWSAGCADGSELYDLGAILEAAGELERTYLLGSDILEENLQLARAKQGAAASPPVRARVRWEQRDLATEPSPPGHWRLILCRNVAIYLRSEVRDDLHRKLAAALAPGGFLMLGRSERIGDPAALDLCRVGASLYRKPA